ncbi:protein kinase rad3 [Echria macrotheca]|uniref:Serine/threonine-protein kinase MEC1 n=1 Tax=Echria macrotheca TaxID=438768 RepID=A0AAJ0B4G9_9PEZI|nr:protein kinase rad3 [Echria macrotheca]
MAPDPYGKPARPAPAGFANANANAAAHDPPPSTLAAQLVGDISTSAASLRPGDVVELEQLSATIEHVNQHPELLKTEEDRVYHNHTLIYVCGGVYLDSLKWQDPFADLNTLRGSALRAIRFLDVAIRETPAVLKFKTDGAMFLLRGKEPLWLWMLPKVLKMLGHRNCLALSPAIESLFQQILLLAAQNSSLWDLSADLTRFLQANLAATIKELRSIAPTADDSPVNIQLPVESFFAHFPGVGPSRCSYTLETFDQGVRHASGLLAIMKNAILAGFSESTQIAMIYRRYAAWLSDIIQPLVALQVSWPPYLDLGLTSTVQAAMELAIRQSVSEGPECVVYQKANTALVLALIELAEQPQHIFGEDPANPELQRIVAESLIHLAGASLVHRPLFVLIGSRLHTRLRAVAVDDLGTPGTEVKLATQVLHTVIEQPNSGPVALEKGLTAEYFETESLRRQIKNLETIWHKKLGDGPGDEPGAKRRKIDEQVSPAHWIIEKLKGLIPHEQQPRKNLDGMEDTFSHAFSQMDEDKQCQMLDYLSRIACATSGTLRFRRKGPDALVQFQCSFCSASDNSTQPPCLEPAAMESASKIFVKIIESQSFQRSRRSRVFGMVTLRRLVKHNSDPSFFDFETSVPGQWCLDSLKSSVRELRIAAGRTFGTYFSGRLNKWYDKSVIRRKQKNALEYLKTLSDRDLPHLHEACILAWGQVGRVISDDELGLVLLGLIEFLGNSNTIVSAWAYNELLNVADARGLPPKRLFQPFWSSLAFSVVKDLVSKPQTASKVAELLQLTNGVPELLRVLQGYALPWLVLKKKRDVIQKIADARVGDDDKDCAAPCIDYRHIYSILALLLVQDVPDITSFAMELLRHVSKRFEKTELVELLRTDPTIMALELFKLAADGDEERSVRVKAALSTMANLLAGSKQKKVKIGAFLQQHALGLVSKLGESITDSAGSYIPAQERRRCLRAMEEMIRVCRSYISISRPQISACLMTALVSDDLRTATISCWEAMITCMDDEDVEALVEATFFIIGHYWDILEPEAQDKCRNMIRGLFEKHKTILKKYAERLPGLDHVEELKGFNDEVLALRPKQDSRAVFGVFAERLNHENPGVVQKALMELVTFLKTDQDYLQISAISEQPDSVVLRLTRSLLDCASKHSGWYPEISTLCAESIGYIGCLDSNRMETTREEQQFVLLHNFEEADETTNFVIYMLENVIVKAFLSTTDVKFQGFLSFAMQELLDRTDLKYAVQHDGQHDSEAVYRKWLSMKESTRVTLTPFLSSRFSLVPLAQRPATYPIFCSGKRKSYASWIRAFVLDLLYNPQNVFSGILFQPLCRLVKVHDLVVAEALLPYVVLHVVVGQENTSEFRDKIKNELAEILAYQPPETASYAEKEEMKLHYEAVFRILDYCMRWMYARKSLPGMTPQHKQWVQWVGELITGLDPEMIAQRAIDCKEYARALFFLEPHIGTQSSDESQSDRLLQTIQDIYTHIDDPDGLEGISAKLQSVSMDQQALNHRKAGRWTAAQTWYEVRLAESPEDTDIQLDLLTCLKESGQHDVLLNYVEGMKRTLNSVNRIVPFAVEASWATSRWKTLEKYLRLYTAGDISDVFDLGVGQALLSLKEGDHYKFKEHVRMLRDKVAGSMSSATTASLRACHDLMLRCHVLCDLEIIVEGSVGPGDRQPVLAALERRLEVLGAYVSDKQYLLGIRRAAMELMRPKYDNQNISSLWLSTARLARKSGSMHQSFNAVLHAQQLGDASAVIENARLLYKDGHHRKAIQVLQLAIDTKSFIHEDLTSAPPTSSRSAETQKNLLTARAHLLLAKWLDSTGQTHASALRSKYQQAAKTHPQWEKGHYYLGRHYKKVLESEKALKPDETTDHHLSGETAKLVIENYLRSLNFGTKYLYQTLPRILTLWLELGAQVDTPPEGKVSLSRELHDRRKKILQDLHRHFQKHLPKMPAFIFYTALPQIVARIAHPNLDVFRVLEQMIVKVVEAYPRQALWSLFSFMTTRANSDRRNRGLQILQTVRGIGKKAEGVGYDLRTLLRAGEKLAEQLLLACNNGDFQSNRTTTASLTKDLNFNHRCTPCPLVVPIETCLSATLPTLTDNVRRHKAFSRDVISIECFLEQVLVLGSLAKPRKLTARGSDGKLYGLLIKPKDDLRTDQRLMEFNGLINRSLKRDAESSRRQLYIKTYAVTPLNEECGIIEWVDGLKTLRDILLAIYKGKGIAPNYHQIAALMKQAAASEASIKIFTDTILGMFPAVLPEWFISQFPNPSAWFAARLRYTRSCAVMSMVGTILGLGDRHGENVLLEEGNGGVFHVDFNCLFDKGLTFAQPERVPFRLTHNMVSAMGIYGTEGPFRHCSELTLKVCRQQEETLMTILEAFIHDPTLDLQRSKKKNEVIKLNPTSVVESIRRKVRGLLPDESIPLGVEGQVEELIKQAVDPYNLARMYIGWCPFL